MPFGEENATAVNDLFRSVFGLARGPDHQRWKFLSGPAGPGLGCVALAPDGRAVAANLGVVWPFQVAGREVRLMQTCETAIRPEWRGLRTFREITAGLGRLAADRGVVASYGGRIAEAPLVLGRRLFGYRQILELPFLEARLSLGPALGRLFGPAGAGLGLLLDRLRRRRPHPAEDRFRIRPVTAYGPEFDRLWRRRRGGLRVARIRSATVLGHRYGACPVDRSPAWLAEDDDGPAGFLVLRLRREEGGVTVATVLDHLDGGDPALAAALLARAGREAAADGAAFLRLAPRPGSALAEAAVGLPGFAPSRREPPDRVVVSLLPCKAAADPANDWIAEILDPDAWTYAPGDSDFHD